MTELRTHASVDEIDPVQWDRLGDGSFYAGHGWVQYQETDPDSRSLVFAVWDQGELLAACATFLVLEEKSRRYRVDQIFPHLASSHRGHVLAGNRRGNSNRLLFRRDDPRGRQALADVVDAVEGYAAAEGDGRAYWLYLNEDDTRELAGMGRASTPRLLDAECSIDLPGSEYADYLSTLSRNARRQHRRDRAAFAEAGYVVREQHLDAAWPEFGVLVGDHERYHGHDLADGVAQDMMRRQSLIDSATVLGAFCEGTMMSGVLTFESSSTLFARAFGTRHANESRSEYFELVYYRQVERAYSDKRTSLHLGVGTLGPKIRRGARVDPLWGVATGMQEADGAESRDWNRDQEQGLFAQLAERPAALRSTLIESPAHREIDI